MDKPIIKTTVEFYNSKVEREIPLEYAFLRTKKNKNKNRRV